ncbi:hypothetical protein [Williamsia sterculiae]|uniref:Uncharacterized protein n=1 Tax=Williamsia sterculiae TaxID=1344003 RepID=A0A1N7F4R0_9NOCA|nr:hypothetical protein [Williamsia sterculiae]SIR95340.1 hypothetical protein SAMN05445060_1804 [Williamsia sterculiae]
MKLEDLNKRAQKVGLHVAAGKHKDTFSVRKVKNGKLVAKKISADEVLDIIDDRK